MKTTVTTTTKVVTMYEAFEWNGYYDMDVYFTSGKTTYRFIGKLIDGGNKVIVGSNDKGYKAFNLSRCEMKNTTLTTVVTIHENCASNGVTINNNGEIYEVTGKGLKGADLEVGKLYADSCYKGSVVARLVEKDGALLTFETVYQPIDSPYYKDTITIGANCGYWYPVNEENEPTSEYVGVRDNEAYYATNEPVNTMEIGGLYAAPANATGERNVYELLEVTPEGYPVMQVQAGPQLSDTKNSGVTTFCNKSNDWFVAYKEPGHETKVGDYVITPVSAEQLTPAGLYADVNASEATIFQYKGVSELGHVKMKILHNASDYCAEVGDVITFPKDAWNFNIVR